MAYIVSIVVLMLFTASLVATPSHNMHYLPNPGYDDLPITPETWKEVSLKYIGVIKHKRYTNTIQLLRPIKWLQQQHMTAINSHIMFSMPEFGIKKINATITQIQPTHIDTRGIDWSAQKTDLVIGKFKHYTTHIDTYTFKGRIGHISHIHATPNHPFYVQNKYAFIPIRDISSHDFLVGKGKKCLSLVCHQGKTSNCGIPYKINAVTAVYNIETYRKHHYSIGNQGIVVHNVCYDANKVRASELLIGEGGQAVVRLDPNDARYVIKDFHLGRPISEEVSAFNIYYKNQGYLAEMITLSDGHPAMRMPKFPGKTLNALTPEEIPNDINTVLQTLKNHIIESGMYPADLKDENILYDAKSNTAYLIDFGDVTPPITDIQIKWLSEHIDAIERSLNHYKRTRKWPWERHF